MPSNFEIMQASPEVRRAHHLAYSVYMLGDVAGSYGEAVDQADYKLARCMVEAFYVHFRLLAEFLVKPTNPKDFGPRDFGVAWAVPSVPESDRLRTQWEVASAYVVHFGRPRVPTDLEDLEYFNVGDTAFRSMASDALNVFDSFLTLLEAELLGWEGGALIPNPDLEPDAWRARLHAEQTTILRSACERARESVDRG